MLVCLLHFCVMLISKNPVLHQLPIYHMAQLFVRLTVNCSFESDTDRQVKPGRPSSVLTVASLISPCIQTVLVYEMELRPFIMCFALCVVYATSKPTEKKDRVHHDDPLSNLEHDDAENFDYDHEAFLGQDEAKTFDQLTPEESKERLR